MPDKERMFKLFEEEGEGSKKDAIKDQIKNIKDLNQFFDSPFAKIGMFTKLIQNHEVFHDKLEKFLKREQPEYNVGSTKEASSFTVYNRAWGYIEKLDLNDEEVKNAIYNFNPTLLRDILNKVIFYFEDKEEYEKCAFLLNIQHISKYYLEN